MCECRPVPRPSPNAEPPDIPGGRNLRRAPPSGLSGSSGDAVRARVRADAHAKNRPWCEPLAAPAAMPMVSTTENFLELATPMNGVKEYCPVRHVSSADITCRTSLASAPDTLTFPTQSSATSINHRCLRRGMRRSGRSRIRVEGMRAQPIRSIPRRGQSHFGGAVSLASSAGPAQHSGVAGAVGDAGDKLASLTEPGHWNRDQANRSLQRFAVASRAAASSYLPPDTAPKVVRASWTAGMQ